MRIPDKNISNILKRRFVLHISFWLAFYSFALLNEWENDKFLVTLEHAFHLFVPFSGFIAASYINLYILIPKYFLPRQYRNYIIFFILTAIITTILFQGIQYFIHIFFIKAAYNEDIIYLFFH